MQNPLGLPGNRRRQRWNDGLREVTDVAPPPAGVRQDTLREMEGIAAERARLVEALHQFDDCQVPLRALVQLVDVRGQGLVHLTGMHCEQSFMSWLHQPRHESGIHPRSAWSAPGCVRGTGVLCFGMTAHMLGSHISSELSSDDCQKRDAVPMPT